jgi:hypothetical protein
MKGTKCITLEEANKEYYKLPDNMPVVCANAYTLTPDKDGFDQVQYWVLYSNFNAKLALGEGWVYILANKATPGILKIGYTDRTPDERVREINGATGVIVPWFVVNAFKCKSPGIIERLVHHNLDDLRITRNKEGFAVSLAQAEDTITRIIKENQAGT